MQTVAIVISEIVNCNNLSYQTIDRIKRYFNCLPPKKMRNQKLDSKWLSEIPNWKNDGFILLCVKTIYEIGLQI